jgi:arylsulfatase A-like enzyme/enamine deaminase RidA (YjgF/YER057c/UK114 family)
MRRFEILFAGLTLALVHTAVGEEQEQALRRITPDAASGTSAAVVVAADTPLAHTTQILPRDAQGRTVAPGRASEQAEAVLERLEQALTEARSGLDRLVKLNVYVAGPEAILAFRAAFATRLGARRGPAISFVEGKLADPGALVAVDAVAATSLATRGNELTRLSTAALAGQRLGGHVAVLPAGGRVYISGQADPGPDLGQATRRTLEGLDRTLGHLGLERSRVVQVKAFMTPMDKAAVEAVEREVTAFFGDGAVPPLTLVAWRSSTPPIEIELVAAGGQGGGKEVVEYITPPALKPSAVFSRVARVNRGDLIYVSGLYGAEQGGGAEQVEGLFGALGKVLESAGSDFRHLVKATYYVTDDATSRALNELRPRYYDPARPPAASKASVAGVGAPGRTVTLDMIAVPRPDAAPGTGRSQRQRPPNVLLLLSDDQRADTIAALGNPVIQTPNLDRLVRAGTTFTRAVSPNPLCVPSRAEILSGCTGFRNGVLPGFSNRLDPELVLWPEAMRRAGYHTCYSGKWDTNGRPTTRGYDESQGLFTSGGPGSKTPRLDPKGRAITGYVGYVFQSDDGRKFPELGVGLTAATPARIADAAIGFLRRRPDRPFFLHVSFTAPHDPLIPPSETAERYDPEAIPLPGNFLAEHPFDHGNLRGRDEQLWPWPRTPRMVREELALYYAVIADLDAQVGRILAALDETGQAEDTIVVFTSDQGLAIGSHGLRGKQNMYEHTVGVPLIVAGPGVPRGRRVRAPIYLRDLYPTICDLAGVAIPPGVEGRSRAGVLRGGEDRGDPWIFGYFTDAQRMVRGDRWKLIRYPRIAREQLFDLDADPLERQDLAADPEHAAVLASLRAELAAWQRRSHDPLAEPRQGEDR